MTAPAEVGAGARPTADPPLVLPAVAPCAKVDLLFVIDDSSSMPKEQEHLRENIPGFLRIIDEFQNNAGKTIDYRIAANTTGVTIPSLEEIAPYCDGGGDRLTVDEGIVWR